MNAATIGKVKLYLKYGLIFDFTMHLDSNGKGIIIP